MPARLLSLARVATRLDVSTATVRRWWGEGIFPAPVYLPNGQPRWHLSTVEIWISSRPAEGVKKKTELQDVAGRFREVQIDPPDKPVKK